MNGQVNSIGSEAFKGCRNIASITIANLITNLGANAFEGGSAMTRVIIPNGITSIGNYAFSGCTALTQVTIPGSVTYLGDSSSGNIYPGNGAFFGCTGLTNVIISSGVTSIGERVFDGCTGLTYVIIPGSVTYLGVWAFHDCVNLVSAYFDGNAPERGYWPTTFPQHPFSGSNKATAYYRSGTTGWDNFYGGLPSALWNDSMGAFAFVITNSALIITTYTGTGGALVIPDAIQGIPVSGIGTNVFYGLGSLTSVSFPNCITSIDSYAFAGCTGLTHVTIPGSVTFLGSWTDAPGNHSFAGCTGLTNVVISCGVTSIGEGVFDGCTGLTNIIIPSSVTYLGVWAFHECANLAGAYFEGNAPARGYWPTTFPQHPFSGSNHATAYYRSGTTGWQDFYAGLPNAVWGQQLAYDAWSLAIGLLDSYPNASSPLDDPDHDGLINFQEMQAATYPNNSNSLLAFEKTPRANDLINEDKTPVSTGQSALYFQSAPGKQYELQSTSMLGGQWQTVTTVTATTTQKRILINKATTQEFYRLVLVQ
jgi:hypothetical protein